MVASTPSRASAISACGSNSVSVVTDRATARPPPAFRRAVVPSVLRDAELVALRVRQRGPDEALGVAAALAEHRGAEPDQPLHLRVALADRCHQVDMQAVLSRPPPPDPLEAQHRAAPPRRGGPDEPPPVAPDVRGQPPGPQPR